jgi:hypothetical protein
MRIDGPSGPGYSIAPTMPHHVARAYGVRPAPSGSAGVAGSIQPAAPAPQPTSGQSEGVRRLVAAVVPGGVEFTATGQPASARQPGGSVPLAMYRHPADKNAAATAVNVGRRLDVHG